MPESAIQEATAAVSVQATLEALADRAKRARARAIVNCESLERAMFRTRDLGHVADCRPRVVHHSHGVAEARIKELEETVEGLLKRLESQGPIEQAKGIIMAQTHCKPDQAFEILRRASQRSNTKLRLLAVDLVARTSKTEIAS